MYILNNQEIDSIRDAAIECEDYDIIKAKKLMQIAHKARPYGTYIIKKLNDYIDTSSSSLKYNTKIKDEIDRDERIEYYINNNLSYPKSNLLEFLSKYQNTKFTLKELMNNIVCFERNKFDYIEYKKDSYIDNLNYYLGLTDKNIKIPVVMGDDLNRGYNLPVFKKARIVNTNNSGILLKLNTHRHYKLIIKDPILWEDKKSEFIWRGATTGHFNQNNNRFKLVNKYGNKYNIGYSGIAQNKKNYWGNLISNKQYKFIKKRMSILGQLKYKYIISLEGNDVATNLKWILASNSVPIMKKPKIESWAMESKLKPYIHYIPINDNLDNLDEILVWCHKNDKECKQIALNGKRFINMFLNREQEDYIHKIILEKYYRQYFK